MGAAFAAPLDFDRFYGKTVPIFAALLGIGTVLLFLALY